MIFKRRDKEIEGLKKRIEKLESIVCENNDDEKTCKKCEGEMIETTELGGDQKQYYCPNCDSFKTVPWRPIELR